MFMTQCQENFMSDPILLTSEQGNIGIVTLNMAHKRNALNEDAIAAIDAYFSAVPSHITASMTAFSSFRLI